jgi:Double zinc ribbon
VGAVFGQVGDAISGFASQPTVRLVVLVTLGYLVMVWLATALWAFVDMRRRTVNPVWPYASAGIVVLASPLLFPLALLLHMVVRPATTVADRRMNALHDAALAVEIDRARCPTCNRQIDDGWLVCPTCRTSLAHLCDQCGHAVGIDWDACPWCGALFAPPAGMVAER